MNIILIVLLGIIGLILWGILGAIAFFLGCYTFENRVIELDKLSLEDEMGLGACIMFGGLMFSIVFLISVVKGVVKYGTKAFLKYILIPFDNFIKEKLS